LQRLERSRRHLHAELFPPPPDEADASGPLLGRWRAWLSNGPFKPWFAALEPWVDSAAHAAHRWWRRHPWRSTAVLVGDTARQTVEPLVRRHPTTAMVAGAVAGAALISLRPWRHRATQRVARGGYRYARRWLLTQLSSPLLHTMLAAAITSLATHVPKRPQPSASQASTTDGASEEAPAGSPSSPPASATAGAAAERTDAAPSRLEPEPAVERF
jgi:hypothetical protein